MNAPTRERYLHALGIAIFRRRGREVPGMQSETTDVQPNARRDAPDPRRSAPSAHRGASNARRDAPNPHRDAPVSADWERLAEEVSACTLCDLHATRTQTVFGVGRRDADLMIIGEAPGADEDRQGEPFVGRAGKLLNAMLNAIGLAREDVYIANILKCRPPGNRDPQPSETARCTPYLERQIALVAPRAVLAVGRIAAQHLLQSDQAIGRLRGKALTFGPARIPIVVTYHPAYLLRSPQAKAKAWQDLCLVRRLITE